MIQTAKATLTPQDIKLIRLILDTREGLAEGRIIEYVGSAQPTHLSKNTCMGFSVADGQIARLREAGLIELAPETEAAKKVGATVYIPTTRARSEYSQDLDLPADAIKDLRALASTSLGLEGVRILTFVEDSDSYIFEPGNPKPVCVVKTQQLLFLCRTGYVMPVELLQTERMMGVLYAYTLTNKARAAIIKGSFPIGSWDWSPTKSKGLLENLGFEELLPEDLEIFWLLVRGGRDASIHLQPGTGERFVASLTLAQPREQEVTEEQVWRLRDSEYIHAPKGKQGEKGLYWFEYVLTDKAMRALAEIVAASPPLELQFDRLAASTLMTAIFG